MLRSQLCVRPRHPAPPCAGLQGVSGLFVLCIVTGGAEALELDVGCIETGDSLLLHLQVDLDVAVRRALDILTLVSLIHRKLDGVQTAAAVSYP